MPFFFIILLVFNSSLRAMEQQEQAKIIFTAVEDKKAQNQNIPVGGGVARAPRVESLAYINLLACRRCVLWAGSLLITSALLFLVNKNPQCVPQDGPFYANSTAVDMQDRSFDLRVDNCNECFFEYSCLEPISGLKTSDQLLEHLDISLGAQCGHNARYSVRPNVPFEPNSIGSKDIFAQSNFVNFADVRQNIACDSKRSQEKIGKKLRDLQQRFSHNSSVSRFQGKQKQPKSRNFQKRSR